MATERSESTATGSKVDPFELLGLEPRARLCPVELERAYLQRSVALHPDRAKASGLDPEEARLRSAELNEAYRRLADPWSRFQLLLERRDPALLERARRLPQDFLLEAMETSEEAERARGDPEAEARLERRLSEELAELERRVERILDDGGSLEEAALACHRARCHQRALQILHGEGGL